jgi:hypothetical protein
VVVLDPNSNSAISIGRNVILDNRPPILLSPSPVNNAIGVSIGLTELSVEMFDANEDTFDWTIVTSPDVGSSSGSGESDGVKTCNILGLVESTTYTWFVNVTDPAGSSTWTNTSYSFTTGLAAGNNPPVVSNENPADTQADVSVITPQLSITINDPENDDIDWTIETSPDVGSSSGTGESDGVKTCSISGLAGSTTYTWFVNVTDPTGSSTWTNTTYTFTTQSASTWTVLTYDDFENGWGNYTDGGIDCLLYASGTYAHQGSNAANIRDNSNDLSSFYYTTGRDVDTPGYTSIKLDFWFLTTGLNNGHDFIVKYWTGSTYVEIERLEYNVDFTNNQFYQKIIWINETEYTFPSDMKILFECDAQNDNDDVYLDEIYVYVK